MRWEDEIGGRGVVAQCATGDGSARVDAKVRGCEAPGTSPPAALPPGQDLGEEAGGDRSALGRRADSFPVRLSRVQEEAGRGRS
jgi:hypothetical protein